MRFFIKTASNFLSFSGNLNSLEDVSNEVNDGDQEVQPHMENPNRKNKRSKKKRIRTGPAYRNSPRTLGHAWKVRKKVPRIYWKNYTRTKRAGRERKGKRQDIFSRTMQIIY